MAQTAKSLVNFDLAQAKWRDAKSLWGQNDDMLKAIFGYTDAPTKLMLAFTCKRFHILVQKQVRPTLTILDMKNQPQWFLIFDEVYSRQSSRSRNSIDKHFKDQQNRNDIIFYKCTDTKKHMKMNFSHVNTDDIVKYNGNIRLLQFAYFGNRTVVGTILPLKNSMLVKVSSNITTLHTLDEFIRDFARPTVSYYDKRNYKIIV